VYTSLIFIVAILLQGFRQDFAAQIKQEYQPDPLFLYFSINGLVAVLALIVSICTWQIAYFVIFAVEHDRLLFDLTLHSVLNSLGVLFTYKLIAIFRQHIYPLVSEMRRCLNVCLNVFWYGHHLVLMQWLGIAIVFSGILIEIVGNYNLASKKLPNHNVRNREANIITRSSPMRKSGLPRSKCAVSSNKTLRILERRWRASDWLDLPCFRLN
jgi:uncharacterized membrane protein